jgi:hypothetical protein
VQRYAKVVNGVVINVTKLDENNIPDAFQSWISCGDAGPGWTYDGQTFFEPAELVPDAATLAANVREQRDTLLAASDWVVTKAVEQNAADGLGIQIPMNWINYRQALRDIPQQAGFPYTVTWPQEP